ncbi:hypothetical protein BD414DRAFT_513087 [Trametes punicea]|nr:hypothetical protein BD414DRAFT_513087 [Trametes punicea]
MRFLDTRTGRFVDIKDPATTRYDILSHQSYQQVFGFWQEAESAKANVARTSIYSGDSSSPEISILDSPALSAKIKGACRIARAHGHELIWIHSCCIDKTSSSELSEAINSMYEWYSKATVRYAYLADVPGFLFDAAGSQGQLTDGAMLLYRDRVLRESKWHMRGWTLQELIAPRYLEAVTGVDTAILTGLSRLDSVSVARRMSWAAHRQTSRLEDQAYSLMGIFGVYMPTIYGEGSNAFLRLQQEIMKTILDQSIFAWGPRSLSPPEAPQHAVPRNK